MREDKRTARVRHLPSILYPIYAFSHERFQTAERPPWSRINLFLVGES